MARFRPSVLAMAAYENPLSRSARTSASILRRGGRGALSRSCGPSESPGRSLRPGLGRAYPTGLRTLRRLLRFELDPLALGERFVHQSGVDGALMNKDVLPATIGGDEPIPLRCVEPFDGACWHEPFLDTHAREAVRETKKETSSGDLRGRGFD